MAISGRVIERRARLRRWRRRAALGAVALFLGAVGLAFAAQIGTVLDLRGERAALALQLQAAREQNQALRGRLALRDDPEHLERLARQLLGLIRPGETKYILPPSLP